ncbi:MAG: hypothetical protein FWE97_01220 [Dehalococcoidia bacterium]|nr:hypothetical protein [Dehalococcoidia bacterium]
MSENKRRVLEMLACGKISVDEAAKLIAALEEQNGSEAPAAHNYASANVRYLRIVVNYIKNHDKPEKVNIRVPVSLIRAGMKFSSLIPQEASEHVDNALRQKGIKVNLRNLKDEDLDTLLLALRDLTVDIDDGRGTVKMWTE